MIRAREPWFWIVSVPAQRVPAQQGGAIWDALVERVLLRVRSGAVGPASPAEGEGRRVSDVKDRMSKGF